jgi:hypothetical protein
MKNLFFILLLIATSAFGQQPTGTLSTIVNGNSVEIKLDSAYRNCGSDYDQQVLFNGDSITWLQVDWGFNYGCDCLYNYSATLDSLNEGDYVASVYFTYVNAYYYYDTASGTWIENHIPCDTTYQGLVHFTIHSLSSAAPFKSDSYASNCMLSIDNHTIDKSAPYPNPTYNTILLKTLKKDAYPAMFDIYGHMCKINTIERIGNSIRLDLTDFSPGIYYLRYASAVYKIIKL